MRKLQILVVAAGVIMLAAILIYWGYQPHPAPDIVCTDSGILVMRDERPLVVIIPSYNNKDWYQKNLDSVFTQKYTNYRVIYIDDCSSDGTASLVAEYIKKHNQQHRCTLIANTSRRWALANHYTAVHQCRDHEIIVNLDGDDWFAHDQVLNRVNAAYENPNVWLTYGQYEEYPSGKRGHCRRLKNATIKLNCYRECDWVTSALRTFYAGLFKQIGIADLLYGGDFFHTACDLAFMFPMLEMAAGRCAFIDEVLYIYNCQTPHNDFKESFLLQTHTDNYIRSRSPYKKIESFNSSSNKRVGVFVWCTGPGNALAQCLQLCTDRLRGVDEFHLLVTCDEAKWYESLCAQYPRFRVHRIDRKNFKLRVAQVFANTSVDYCLCMPHTAEIITQVDLADRAAWLARTHANGFCMSLGKSVNTHTSFDRAVRSPSLCALDEGIYAWMPEYQEGDWKVVDPLTCVLVPSNAAKTILSDLAYSSFDQLRQNILYVSRAHAEVYLCGDSASITELST